MMCVFITRTVRVYYCSTLLLQVPYKKVTKLFARSNFSGGHKEKTEQRLTCRPPLIPRAFAQFDCRHCPHVRKIDSSPRCNGAGATARDLRWVSAHTPVVPRGIDLKSSQHRFFPRLRMIASSCAPRCLCPPTCVHAGMHT